MTLEWHLKPEKGMFLGDVWLAVFMIVLIVLNLGGLFVLGYQQKKAEWLVPPLVFLLVVVGGGIFSTVMYIKNVSYQKRTQYHRSFHLDEEGVSITVNGKTSHLPWKEVQTCILPKNLEKTKSMSHLTVCPINAENQILEVPAEYVHQVMDMLRNNVGPENFRQRS